MIPLAGYADRLSVRPGETIHFHVSNATAAKVSGQVVRVRSADANPASPGIKTDAIRSAAFSARDVGNHPVHSGSFARVDLGQQLKDLTNFTLTALVWPTRLGQVDQPIVSWLDPAKGTGFTLSVAASGKLAVAAGHGDGKVSHHETALSLTERAWAAVMCIYDADAKLLRLTAGAPGAAGSTVSEIELDAPIAPSTNGMLCIGASSTASFNGKIEAPALYRAWTPSAETLVARWDFSKEMMSSRIVDVGPHGLHGELINQPTRAMTGHKWNGREMCWRHATDQYGAIHFHDDDLDDCQWPVAFEWTVPADMKNGCYALLLDAGDAKENIPFFVVPPKGKATADIAVLISTYTYTVYGNHARPEWTRDPAWRDAWIKQSKDWGGYPHNPGAHTEYGLSTYNFHNDGSGIGHASWHRPMMNLRIGFITYPYPEIRASGLRHYPADMHLIAWLEAKGYSFDVITDAELDAEGEALLKPYAVVMTGSHPEYHTPAMLDALEGYRDNGGRLMYLGGNGFYWKIALNPEKPGCVEIRRAEGGIRAWSAETGEYYNQFDGEYGGLWRRNGRPPQKLAGVGFTAQGNFVGSHYRIKPDARASRGAWILEGIKDETIGGFGLSGHGAAGFELDRAEKRLGTPAHAVILASSEGHKPEAPWVLVPEEQLTHIVTWAGEPAEKLIRADLTFFETTNNGAVFAVGSITFCGSLLHSGGDNAISRLTANVLDRFADRAAVFEVPTA